MQKKKLKNRLDMDQDKNLKRINSEIKKMY